MTTVLILAAGHNPVHSEEQTKKMRATADGVITLETDYVAYAVSPHGENLSLVDKLNGTNYLDRGVAPHVAHLRKAGAVHNVSAAAIENGRLVFAFGDSGVTMALQPRLENHYITLKVVAVSDEQIEELTFFDAALRLKGDPDEPFAGCALALNLRTNVPAIPGPNARLRAICYPRFGLVGAEVAVIACPMGELRNVMKEVVGVADELPRSNIGGPWAQDAEINRGSYLFDFGQITESTVDDWIRLARDLGMNQIDFHTGYSLRFGDYRPSPQLYPNGYASVRAVTDKLHAAGILAGLHTYAFFIAKDTPWVTPVPDPRLGKDATFTLAEAITAEAAVVPVVECTAGMSTITGFQVRNSVTLQIDDELITYTGISKEPPYAFTGCQRGACGTTPAPHAQGAKVHHLKECFGLFAPDADSTLLTEVAARTAEAFNECGFDMIYLDALDGEDILAGGENGWHYGSKFVFELCKRLHKPALMEMSTFHHHLWCVRSRMGAWDHPTRSHKRFVDVHCRANDAGRGMFLPMHLGWWAVKTWADGPHATQNEPTFSDDIEYLMCKCLGSGVGFSLMGVNPETLPTVPAYQRLAPIFKQYESLRHANTVPESVKAKLRVPGEEFTLELTPDGKRRFRPVQYAKHKVQGLDGWSNVWTMDNRFERQPARFRIEALFSAAPYDSSQAVALEDFTQADTLSDRATQEGVSAALEAVSDPVKVGSVSGRYVASSTRPDPNGAWSKIGKVFSPPLDISTRQALGLWVCGDGCGELLNIQLKSPEHVIGGIGDHYVTVDFTGWRYFELIEPEGGRIEDYQWPYGNPYSIYREWVDYAQVESLSLWYNHLPPGKEVACYLSPIKAMPLLKTALRNPSVRIGSQTITFPVEIRTGNYLEFISMDDCKLYDANGAIISGITPEGQTPILEPGKNRVEFSCELAGPESPRAYVTIMSSGEPLQE